MWNKFSKVNNFRLICEALSGKSDKFDILLGMKNEEREQQGCTCTKMTHLGEFRWGEWTGRVIPGGGTYTIAD